MEINGEKIDGYFESKDGHRTYFNKASFEERFNDGILKARRKHEQEQMKEKRDNAKKLMKERRNEQMIKLPRNELDKIFLYRKKLWNKTQRPLCYLSYCRQMSKQPLKPLELSIYYELIQERVDNDKRLVKKYENKIRINHQKYLKRTKQF